MAIYHLHIDLVKRSLGHSSVAFSAYCSALKIKDKRTCLIHDFSKKSGVVKSSILIPNGAPVWMTDRKKLWNAVEENERRKDAQVARIIDVALPVELSVDQNWELLNLFVRSVFVDQGMVADINLHNDNLNNPHAHILLTLRRTTANGFERCKVRDWNKTDFLLHCRKMWAEYCNRYLELYNFVARIDHRSHLERGIDREPTIHMGRAYNALKYGKRVLDRVERNRDIILRNALLQYGETSQVLSGIVFFSSNMGQDQVVDDEHQLQMVCRYKSSSI